MASKRRVRKTSQPFTIPAPMGGINVTAGLASTDPKYAIYSYNLLPSKYGLQVRPGFKEYALGITGTGGVRGLIPVRGALTAYDRLFAASADGIWNISASTLAAAKVVTFGTTTGNAGFTSWTNFTAGAGQYAAVCDEVNGYHHYKLSTGTWTKLTLGAGAGQVANVDPATLVFVTEYKGRLLFAAADSSKMWYLGLGAVEGAALSFEWGDKFPHGGKLVGLYGYSVDGGQGVESLLVAISSTGDVLLYEGIDPAADFKMRGKWYVGDIPAGYRGVTRVGGDLLILTASGAVPLTSIVRGEDLAAQDAYLTKNIAPLIKADMSTLMNSRGWEAKIDAKRGVLYICAPLAPSGVYTQYVQDLTTRAWGQYRGLPINTCESYSGEFYIGSTNGTVYRLTGSLDYAKLIELPAKGFWRPGFWATGFWKKGFWKEDLYVSTNRAIDWALLTSFQNGGSENQKQVDVVRPYFLASSAPSWKLEVRYDFQLGEIAAAPIGSPVVAGTWDSATWDTAVWGGETAAYKGVQGGAGMGTYVAIALKGQSSLETTLLTFGGSAKAGGFM